MAKLTKAAQDEIRAAVEILKSDGIHIHKTYAAFQKSLTNGNQGNPTDPSTDPPDTTGQPPPVKDQATDPPKKCSLWWGDRI